MATITTTTTTENNAMEDAMLTRRGMLHAADATGASFVAGRAAAAPSTVKTPVDVAVPRGACDCHVHVFSDPNKFPFAPDRVYTPPAASVDDLRALQAALGFERVVIVTPSVYGLDNSCTLVLGVASAYFGGRLGLLLERINDVIMAFPLIILALAVLAVFGGGVFNVILALTLPLIPRCARVVRSSALAIREVPYIDAARACGFGHTRIILRHMVPNVLAPFLIMLTAFVGQAILAEASLSYLGLGVQEPVAAWGL